MKSMNSIQDCISNFCENGATKAVIEKIKIKDVECWTVAFKDEIDAVYGALNIKELSSSEIETLFDVITERRLFASINALGECKGYASGKEGKMINFTGRYISTQEALAEVEPFPISEDVLLGQKVLIISSPRKDGSYGSQNLQKNRSEQTDF